MAKDRLSFVFLTDFVCKCLRCYKSSHDINFNCIPKRTDKQKCSSTLCLILPYLNFVCPKIKLFVLFVTTCCVPIFNTTSPHPHPPHLGGTYPQAAVPLLTGHKKRRNFTKTRFSNSCIKAGISTFLTKRVQIYR